MINSKAMQIDAEIISNKRIGSYNHMVFAVNELAGACRPGNFVAIAVGGQSSSMILRRAFAIYRATMRADGIGLLELVVAPQGNGSKWLSSQPVGQKVNVIAPLGTSFGIPTEPVSALLVGGGYGSAPLFALAETLKSRGCRVDMVLGASTAGKIYAPLEGKRSVNSLTITTDDGSAGNRCDLFMWTNGDVGSHHLHLSTSRNSSSVFRRRIDGLRNWSMYDVRASRERE